MSHEIVHNEEIYPATAEFLGTVSHTFHAIDSADLDSLPPYLLAQGARAASEDRLKQRIVSEVQKYDFDVASYVSQWLNLQRSDQTRRAYQRSWDTFQMFLGLQAQDIHLFDVNRNLAKKFLLYLRDRHHDTRATIELRIAAIQSLYSSLLDDKLLTYNPFRHLAKHLPAETPTTYRIPSDFETERLLAALTGRQHCAMLLIARYGIRIGLLPTIEIDGHGCLLGQSKNKPYYIRMVLYKTPIDHAQILEEVRLYRMELFGKTEESLRSMLNKQFVKYQKRGILTQLYSPHDWRHAVAIREYAIDHDIDRVRKLLNHRNINTTQRYLQELSVS